MAEAERIPGDLPFVVRRSPRKCFAMLTTSIGSVWVVLVVELVIELLLIDPADRTAGYVAAVLSLPLCVLLAAAAVAAVAVRFIVALGPVLALGPDGLWIKDSTAIRARPVWLPWESVDRIVRRRVWLSRAIAVTPRGSAARYYAPLRLNQQTEAAILAAIADYHGPLGS